MDRVSIPKARPVAPLSQIRLSHLDAYWSPASSAQVVLTSPDGAAVSLRCTTVYASPTDPACNECYAVKAWLLRCDLPAAQTMSHPERWKTKFHVAM